MAVSSVNSKLRMFVKRTLTSTPVVSLGRRPIASAIFCCRLARYSLVVPASLWSLLQSSRWPATSETRRSCSQTLGLQQAPAGQWGEGKQQLETYLADVWGTKGQPYLA